MAKLKQYLQNYYNQQNAGNESQDDVRIPAITTERGDEHGRTDDGFEQKDNDMQWAGATGSAAKAVVPDGATTTAQTTSTPTVTPTATTTQTTGNNGTGNGTKRDAEETTFAGATGSGTATAGGSAQGSDGTGAVGSDNGTDATGVDGTGGTSTGTTGTTGGGANGADAGQGGNETDEGDTERVESGYTGEQVKPVTTFQDIVKQIYSDPTLTAEQKRKLAKKERIEKIISALGDFGANAINLWGTIKGGRDIMPENGAPLTTATQTAWDKRKAEQAAKVKEYQKALIEAIGKDNAETLSQRKEARLQKQADQKAVIDNAKLELQQNKSERESLIVQSKLATDDKTRELIAKRISDLDIRDKVLQDKLEHPERWRSSGRGGSGKATASQISAQKKKELYDKWGKIPQAKRDAAMAQYAIVGRLPSINEIEQMLRDIK